MIELQNVAVVLLEFWREQQLHFIYRVWSRAQHPDFADAELVFTQLFLVVRPGQLEVIQHKEEEVEQALDVVTTSQTAPTTHIHRGEHKVSWVAVIHSITAMFAISFTETLAASKIYQANFLIVLSIYQHILQFQVPVGPIMLVENAKNIRQLHSNAQDPIRVVSAILQTFLVLK